MRKEMDCLRCGTRLQYLKTEKLQLGQTGWLMGDLPNLFAGALELEIYYCPACGKLEFFRPEGSDAPQIAQIRCPVCGALHDMDDPKCPFCKS